MKKANRLVTIFLMVCMVLASGGLLYATMYASGAGTQSTQTTVAFDAPSGIRYNELTGAFEVFSGVGVSWIGSNGWVSTLGEFSKDTSETPPDTQTSGMWYQATRTSTYNIMCDVTYASVFQSGSPTEFVPAYNEAFNNGITLEEGGKIYGRGFFLSGFPVRNAAAASALIASNAGIIRNINMTDVNFSNVATANTAAGILCGTNEAVGLIDECAVYGSYSTARFTRLFGIAAINNGTIMNSTNNANITNTKAGITYTAGIAELKENCNTVNNTNNGRIVGTSTTARAAGIGMALTDVEFILGGNVNNGQIDGGSAKTTSNSTTGYASGIVGGASETLYNMRATDNTNNARLYGGVIYLHYFGRITVTDTMKPMPINGIGWNPDLKIFEVYNSAGVSHIAMMHWVSPEGLVSTTAKDGYEQASRTSTYRIMNDIEYDESELGFFEGFKDYTKAPDQLGPVILPGGIVDGGGYTLSYFPLREVGNLAKSGILVSALFCGAFGVLENLNLRLGLTEFSRASYYCGGVSAFVGGMIRRICVSGELEISGNFVAGGMLAGQTGAYKKSSSYDVSFPLLNNEVPYIVYDIITFGKWKIQNGPAGVVGNGILGSNTVDNSYISNMINFAEIIGSTRASGFLCYGAGDVWVPHHNLVNYGNIIAITGAGGGAAGITVVPPSKAKNPATGLINYGNVTSPTNAGGIFATWNVAVDETCDGYKNYGDVIGGSLDTTGAIIGNKTTSTGTLSLTNCYNAGRIGISTDLKTGADVRFVGNVSTIGVNDGNGNVSVVPS